MKKRLLLVVLFCCQIVLIFSQKIVTGTVNDNNEEPLVGAYVIMAGTNYGTVTDVDGRFSLTVPNEETVLHISFLGFETQALSVKNIDKYLNIKLLEKENVLDVFTKIGYSCCTRICNGCFLRAMITYWDLPIEVHPLSNGAVKLSYSIDVRWLGKEDYRSNSYREKTVYYRIKKSRDDVYYKQIGSSVSDTTSLVFERADSTHIVWGTSQYLDKEISDADVVFYEVEGYILRGEEDDEFREEEIVYRQKTKVSPVKNLKINSLYTESATRKIDITAWSAREDITDFIIVDMSGRVVKRFQQRLSAQENYVTILDCDLISGTYVLTARQGDYYISKKFAVVK
jgi:hypothetical protein